MADLTGLTDDDYNLYRLTRVAYPGPRGTTEYGYDRAGNRESVTLRPAGGPPQTIRASYGAANGMTSFGGAWVEHDASGNMTRKGDVEYEWDGQNRLIRVRNPDKGVTVAYTYNGDNLRVRKVNETTGEVT